MKKFFLIIAAALTAAASCQKNDTVPASTEIKYNPIDLTLTASIEGAGTKVSYTEESNALKAAWEKGDQISLVALDGSGNVLSNDVFKTTSGGAAAYFEGKYSNPDGASSVAVFYPALTEGDGTESTPWHSKFYDKNQSYGTLYDLKKNALDISWGSAYQLQTKNADPSSLKNAVVMRGEVSDVSSLVSGKASATVKSCCYVIKANIKVPLSFKDVAYILFEATEGKGITMYGWTYANSKFGIRYANKRNSICIGLGKSLVKDTSKGTGIAPEDGSITAYLVGYGVKSYTITSGTTLTVSIESTSSNKQKTDKTLASDISLEPGKMYRMNIDMTK